MPTNSVSQFSALMRTKDARKSSTARLNLRLRFEAALPLLPGGRSSRSRRTRAVIS